MATQKYRMALTLMPLTCRFDSSRGEFMKKETAARNRGAERKSLNEFPMLKFFYEQMEAILDNLP